MSPKILVPILSVTRYTYCLGSYLVIKGVVESPLIIIGMILSYPGSNAAVHAGHIYNTSDSLHVW